MRHHPFPWARLRPLGFLVLLGLSACEGDDGADGRDGVPGEPGAAAVLRETPLAPGHALCFAGGLLIESGLDRDGDGRLDEDEVEDSQALCHAPGQDDKAFERIAVFEPCRQHDPDCDTDVPAVAEIVAADDAGERLVYTDGAGGRLGFIDIQDPARPTAAGTVELPGEPTSVAVVGEWVLAAVDTGSDHAAPAGRLMVFQWTGHAPVAEHELDGQPDAVAVSPDGRWAAVVIENERDEDVNDGALPQSPPGRLLVFDLGAQDPQAWSVRAVELTGLAERFADDPEPEYVAINEANVAAVTLQENNHIVLVDLPSAAVVGHFSAGAADLVGIDATEEDPPRIDQRETLTGVLREPDGVAWIDPTHLVTANEGDLDGGARGFTVFTTDGDVVYESGAELDRLAARFGHYPEHRSANRGNEPENVAVAVYGDRRFLFVASERASLIFVYEIDDPARPRFRQVLPAAWGPEGLLPLPGRNLLVAASEEDERGTARAALTVYRYAAWTPSYPTLAAADRLDGAPIPWAALSGLAGDPWRPDRGYTVPDSAFGASRIYVVDLAARPARIVDERVLRDRYGVFAGIDPATLSAELDEAEWAALHHADLTVDLDLEGVAAAQDGGFWVVSEGAGSAGDDADPVRSVNLLLKLDPWARIEQVVALPAAENAAQRRFGFEGVVEAAGRVWVAVQRPWAGDDPARTRLYAYDPATGDWTRHFYPLDAPLSPYGGWVGVSGLARLPDGGLLVLERDNQSGPDARIKRLYRVDPAAAVPDGVLSKTLWLDLLPVLADDGRAPVPEKVEGVAVAADGAVWIVNDNDAVDDSGGETRLLRLSSAP